MVEGALWGLRSARRIVDGRGLKGHWPGHSGVTGSLVRGLRRLGVEFRLDPLTIRTPTAIGVVAGERALSWAVRNGERLGVGGFVVGPNVSVFASELPGAFDSPLVDTILVPSDWVKNRWAEDSPHLRDKIRVWPCGVNFDYWAPTHARAERSNVLVYVKATDDPFVQQVTSILHAAGFAVREVRYGDYSPGHYLEQLRESACLVYIGGSESQGLALLEAWAADVPTFVFDAPRQEIQLKNHRAMTLVRGQFSPAPYLGPETGALWSDPEELPDLCAGSHRYAPRAAAVDRFSDVAAAQAYVSLFT